MQCREGGTPMKVELKDRDKNWGKAVAFCILMLACAVFFLALGVYHKETVGIVVGGIGTALFGAGTFLLLNPSQLAKMQVVKGEMTYKQLKEAVEAEDFEKPIRFFQKDGHPGYFLVSENWAVFEEHGNPIYVPKSKVRRIELMSEPVELGPEYSGDGGTYLHYLYYFKFTCDKGQAFVTGLIWHDRLEQAWHVIKEHFPHIPIEEVHTPKEWKQ